MVARVSPGMLNKRQMFASAEIRPARCLVTIPLKLSCVQASAILRLSTVAEIRPQATGKSAQLRGIRNVLPRKAPQIAYVPSPTQNRLTKNHQYVRSIVFPVYR
jgi:hypothetical protein